MRAQAALLYDVTAVYGIHFASQLLPLLTVPYLSRVLGPAGWGLVAIAQAFGTYGNMVIDYGFVYSATRDLATATSHSQAEHIIAGVTGAKLLLSAGTLAAAAVAYQAVRIFHEHPLLLWAAVLSEIVKALAPVYYFYGIKRVAIASALDISARVVSTAGIFLFVHQPADAWIIFMLNGAAAAVTLVIGYAIVRRRHALLWPSLRSGWNMVREGWAMFLFRSSHSAFTLGNAFVLGLFVSPQAVGYYAGAEKIGSACTGLLTPLTTVLYPRAAALARNSLQRAARVTRFTLYLVGAASVALGLLLWAAAPLIIRLVLGSTYEPSVGVLRILSLRAPLIAWTNTLGFQWLLVLGMERQFQKVTLAALILNTALAALVAPRYSYNGMAWVVLISQAAAALGIFVVLQRRRLNPFAGDLVRANA